MTSLDSQSANADKKPLMMGIEKLDLSPQEVQPLAEILSRFHVGSVHVRRNQVDIIIQDSDADYATQRLCAETLGRMLGVDHDDKPFVRCAFNEKEKLATISFDTAFFSDFVTWARETSGIFDEAGADIPPLDKEISPSEGRYPNGKWATYRSAFSFGRGEEDTWLRAMGLDAYDMNMMGLDIDRAGLRSQNNGGDHPWSGSREDYALLMKFMRVLKIDIPATSIRSAPAPEVHSSPDVRLYFSPDQFEAAQNLKTSLNGAIDMLGLPQDYASHISLQFGESRLTINMNMVKQLLNGFAEQPELVTALSMPRSFTDRTANVSESIPRK